jgi:SAM-dependent methyltransferase
MRQDGRAALDERLRPARLAAYAPGEFVGQESFMRAGEILALARRAGVAPGVSVLDLCCGVAGPGRFVTAQLGCEYLGVDSSAGAIGLARARAAGLRCRFQVARVPPVPAGHFDVVLLLETMLAFDEKDALLHGIASALRTGGRFAFTVEEGLPLTEPERRAMPNADTVWPVPMTDLVAGLERVGLRIRWMAECSRSHREVADALVDAFTARRPVLADSLGDRVVDDLVASHRLWSDWLGAGRVRKLAVVAHKVDAREAGCEKPATSPRADEPER